MTRALTPRESQVLVELALNGGTDAELAERLGMSTGTVRSHLGHLRAKLGVHSSKDLVAAFWRAQRGLRPLTNSSQ